MHELGVVILAAGHGKRMQRALPKVLHQVAGMAMLERVCDSAAQLNPARIVVVHSNQFDLEATGLKGIHWAAQDTPQGTGHAVHQALSSCLGERLLVLFGDVPLISVQTLESFMKLTPQNSLGLMTLQTDNPTGLGRIVRGHAGEILKIIEEKDASDEIRKIQEVNTGIFLGKLSWFQEWLPHLSNNNAQKEYYLTDVVGMAIEQDIQVFGYPVDDALEVQGVNTLAQLAQVERAFQMKEAEKLMAQGVQLMDPTRLDVRGALSCGAGTSIDVNVIFEGENTVGKDCVIGANCIIRNTKIADGVRVEPFSHLEGAELHTGVRVGPYARLREGTVLFENSRVGNFVELKKATLGPGSKANHLSYIGDATIGAGSNIGAGTIFCNYDGVNKHTTIVGDGVFIGSGSQLVAPVVVGDNATLGAGTTLTKEAPAGQLTLSRAPQKTIASWQRPAKHKKGDN